MSEGKIRGIAQATPFQRFTIRLIDGKFVRVPKSNLPSVDAERQSATSNQTEIRDLFRLVNGRFIRVLNLDTEDDGCIGKQLPAGAKAPPPKIDDPVAKKKN